MGRLTPIDRLSASIEKILEDYKEGVIDTAEEVTKEIGKAGARALRQASPSRKGKKYASGWTCTIEGDRVVTTAILHNAKMPGLPHLLEHGHVLRNGTGRTFGFGGQRPHIAAIEQQLIDTYETKIKNEVGR